MRYNDIVTVMKKTEKEDGLGGLITQWVDDYVFNALVGKLSTTEKDLATKKELTENWIIICAQDVILERDDYVKFDNRYLRITSQALKTPSIASARIKSQQYTAELVEEI